MSEPRTFLVGKTAMYADGLVDYLKHTNQTEFSETLAQANCKLPLKLVSTFAKLCYKSLVTGKNQNVKKTRDIESNIKAVIDSGHGSVLEHITFNFIITGCSRVFTHELVRHRVGTAFSQTSGRYCTLDADAAIVLDPILGDEVNKELQITFDKTVQIVENLRARLIDEKTTFDKKKKITSALRRIAPSGLANEIAFSANLRTLRNLIELRTSVHAESEIRFVFNQIADILMHEDPLYLYGGKQNTDGEWTGLKV